MVDESEPQSATEKKGPSASGISGKTCYHKLNGTNLVVCIDGTSNQFGEKNTNVIELYNLILKEAPDKQKTWYNSGIGTYARPSRLKSLKYYKNVLYHKIDLAIAWDFERTVLGAYRWLSDNYKDGDCIYLFGFSRGAYQVRVLSAMIYKVGLIHKGNEMQIPFAYELYADPSTDKPSTATAVGSLERNTITMAQRFKNTFSHKNVKVHFVGAWDTVSSIGLVRGARMLPWTVDGMKHVCYFRHALALDERRVKFLPEYVYGGRATDPGDKTQGTNNEDSRVTQSMNPDACISPQAKETGAVSVKKESSPQRHQTLEVWFAGTHSDIGGGNVQNEGMDRSRPPLRWMVFEAQAVGLRMAPFNRDLSREELIEVQESLTWPWWPLELLPIKRLSFTRKDDGKHQFTYKPHLGSTRKIHPGQKIHSSLLLFNRVYNPKARPPEGDITFWDNLRNEEGFKCKWVEFDLYEHAASVMEDFIQVVDPDNTSHTLRNIAASSEGRQALYKKAIEALTQNHPPLTKCRILGILIDAAQENSRGNLWFERSPLSEIQHTVSDLLKSEEYQKAAKEFIARFTDRCINILRGHKAQVNSVAFSPNGELIASASDDYTVRIWSVETWRQMHELSGHLVSAVAFFPHGRHIVSGSWDNCLWIWDVETGKQVGEPLIGHEDCITTVAVSPNGEKIASGSRDMTVRIWNVETGEPDAPFRGQTGSTQSVAFSPDGKCVASGSNDGTTWIRDLRTGEQIGKPLQAHEDLVMTVSFSLDGHHIASGSADFTIQLFDSQTGAPKRTFLGHEDVVRSVVFSPDGKRLASGSSDNTVRVWDVETGKQLGAPLQGHTGGVRSVSFSPDGNQVVSGSSDYTIRIWDAGA